MKNKTIARQQGVVLVISMIMLLLLTIIGTSSIQTAGQQEKLSHNYRDKYSAMQAAEAALRAGEQKINSAGSINAIAGLIGQSAARPNVWQKSTWSGSNSIEYASGISTVSEQPRYYIKLLSTEVINNPGLNTDHGINLASPTYGGLKRKGAAKLDAYDSDKGFFEITAKGASGLGSKGQVLLRSHFWREFK